MSWISVFDVLGPNMIGPSSSHTAGAVSMARLARGLAAGKLKRVEFILYGSFARTYQGHGTDRALLGGIMGFRPDDRRIPDSFAIADRIGLEYSFVPDRTETDLHPNTADMVITSEDGRVMRIRGESLGGGKVRITRINEAEVDITGEYETIVVMHEDKPGAAAHITRCLSEAGANIAFMKLFRESRGSMACSVVELDGQIPAKAAENIRNHPCVRDVMLLRR